MITRDPDNGYLNVGTYRMMVQGQVAGGPVSLAGQGRAAAHHRGRGRRAKPIQVAAAWGIDPLFMLVGSQKFPKDISEYEYAGGVKGEPIPVVRGHDDRPAAAGQRRDRRRGHHPAAVGESRKVRSASSPATTEGPKAAAPLVEITAMHYRSNPILTNALMADYPSCEQSGFFACCARRGSGTTSRSSACRASRVSTRTRRPPAASA